MQVSGVAQVGSTAWDNPWQVIRNAQPMFGTETKKKVDTIWEEMKKRTNFFNPTPKKTRDVKKVVVFGGGSFATALAVAVARRQPGAQVIMLLRNTSVRDDINIRHKNNKYLGVRLCWYSLRSKPRGLLYVSGPSRGVGRQHLYLSSVVRFLLRPE
jgi:hypothetical protein